MSLVQYIIIPNVAIRIDRSTSVLLANLVPNLVGSLPLNIGVLPQGTSSPVYCPPFHPVPGSFIFKRPGVESGFVFL
jgi:hypothetical protein